MNASIFKKILKKSELIFNAIQLPLDYLMLVLTGIIIYSLRYDKFVTEIQPIHYDLVDLSFATYLGWVMLISLLFVFIFAFLGLYKIGPTKKFQKNVINVLVGVSVGFAFIVFASFLDQSIFAPRFFVLTGWFFAVILIIIGRFLLRLIQKYILTKYKYGKHKTVIIGDNKISKEFQKHVRKNPQVGYSIVKVLDRISISALNTILKKHEIDEIILVTSSQRQKNVNDLIDFSNQNKITYKYIPTLSQARLGNVKMGTVLSYPIIELLKTPLEGWLRILKRFVDVVGSAIAIILFSPPYTGTGSTTRTDG